MPYTVKHFPQGTFSWADVTSSDIASTKKFLTGLFGWTSEDRPTTPGKPDYTMFYLDGKVVAGAGPVFQQGMHAYWSSYVTVDNVDEMAAKAEKLGGKVVMPAMDVMDAGRMVGVQDPCGATVFLWQPKRTIGAEVVNTPGAMSWNELYVKDVETAKKFYEELFGWTYGTDPANPVYTTIKNNGRSNGGIMPILPEMAMMPPQWMVYFTVKNLDESLAKVKELGGKVWDTKDISVGKIGIISEPSGAGMILMEMSPSMPPQEVPEEWTK
jgi:predicted enzyme related to lactoylglutathione lyase